MTAPPGSLSGSGSFMIGDWCVEPSRDRLSRRDRCEYIEPKAMAVLVRLAERAGEVVSADELIDLIWNGRPLGDNPIYKCIARLRKVLEDDPHEPKFIETVPKKGYCLVVPVTVVGKAHTEVPAELSAPGERSPRGPLPRWIFAPAFVLLLILVLVPMYRGGGGGGNGMAGESAHSIAVMPFASDIAVDRNGAVTGRGIAEDLSQQLSRVPELRVVSHSSAATLNSEELDIQTIADLLGVNYILLGTITLDDDQLGVIGRMLNSRGEEVWHRSFSGGEGEFFTVVEEIVQSVSDYMEVGYDPNWVSACGGTRNLEACQRFLLAEEHMSNGGQGFKSTAIRLLEEAVALDPEFASAYARMAHVYLERGREIPWPEAVRRAELAIERALELDPDSNDAYRARALALMTDRQGPCPPACRKPGGFEAAEEYARKAVALNPGDWLAHNTLAHALYGQGKLRQAFTSLNTALKHDPLNPGLIHNIAVFRALQGDYAGARQHLLDFIRQHPNPPVYLHERLILGALDFGEFEEGISRFADFDAETVNQDINFSTFAKIYLDLGLLDRLEALLASKVDDCELEPEYVALHLGLLSARGEVDALEAFGRELADNARSEYGQPDEWPRWLLRAFGQHMFAVGRFEAAVDYLDRVYGDRLPPVVNHQQLIVELDALHAFGYSLIASGREQRGESLIAYTLEMVDTWEKEGYTGFPGLTAAKARAFAIQGRKAYAVATMKQAVAQGWRRYYWTFNHHDPRWSLVLDEPDFQELIARVRQEVIEIRAQVDTHSALLDAS